jgi:hypothetical protein
LQELCVSQTDPAVGLSWSVPGKWEGLAKSFQPDGRSTSLLQKPDKKLGYVRIPVEEVARNKSMKDEWPLLEADKGDIQLRWPALLCTCCCHVLRASSCWQLHRVCTII